MEATGVWKLYASGSSTIEAVRGVNLTLNLGEMVAVMGPSGCGKTTLLNVLSGIDEPTAGGVMVNNKPLFGINDNERTSMRSKYLGFIFQDFNLLPVLSAAENVELPLLLLGVGGREAELQQHVQVIGVLCRPKQLHHERVRLQREQRLLLSHDREGGAHAQKVRLARRLESAVSAGHAVQDQRDRREGAAVDRAHGRGVTHPCLCNVLHACIGRRG